MTRSVFRSIKHKLLLVFVLTSLVPLIGLSVYSYRYFNDVWVDAAKIDLAYLNKQTTDRLNVVFLEAVGRLFAWRERPEWREPHDASNRKRALLQGMAHETHLFETLFLLDDIGTIIATNRETKAGVANRYHGTEGLVFPGHEGLDQEEVAISAWQNFTINNVLVSTIMLSFPVLDEDDEFLGTVVGSLDVATLVEPLKQELSELEKRGFGSSIVAIIDASSGRVLMRVGGEAVPLETIGLEGDDPSSRTSHIEDASWLAFADETAFGENELAVVTLTAMSVLAQATRRLVQISGVIYPLVIAVLGIVVVWMTKTLSDPLRRLADQAEEFGKGELLHRNKGGRTGRNRKTCDSDQRIAQEYRVENCRARGYETGPRASV